MERLVNGDSDNVQVFLVNLMNYMIHVLYPVLIVSIFDVQCMWKPL